MDEKRIHMAPQVIPTSFTRRPRLFSVRRLLLAIILTSIIFYFYPTILSSITLPGAPSQPAQEKEQDAALPKQFLSHPSPEQQPPITSVSKPDQADQSQSQSQSQPKPKSGTTASANKKPRLEAHLMSKCPDARDCLQELVVPAMSQISNLVDFELFYIGSVGSDNSSVTCKHGPEECLGNSISLCAQALYGSSSSSAPPTINAQKDDENKGSKISLGFTNCLIADYARVPDKELVQDCALEHGVDFEALNRCVSEDGRGEELLRESVLASKEKGVKYSCTVRLQDDIWCVRDSGLWKECGKHGGSVDALVQEIRRLSK